MIEELTETERNLKMLKDFFTVPEICSDPKAFLRKRRTLAEKLYEAAHKPVEDIPSIHYYLN